MCEQIKLSDLDQDMLKILFDEGGFFIFLDVPIGTEFGIDMKVWNTDKKFKGIKMIPPGIHFIHYSSVDSCDETGQRSGFFHNFKNKEILVKRWDSELEDISSIPVTEEEVNRIRENIRNMDKYLGSYPYDIYAKWMNLSNHINGKFFL